MNEGDSFFIPVIDHVYPEDVKACKGWSFSEVVCANGWHQLALNRAGVAIDGLVLVGDRDFRGVVN